MFFKKENEWPEIILWIAVIATVLVMGYGLWYGYIYLSIAMLIVLLALLLLLGYCKYRRVMKLRKKFVIAQESFSMMMLMYFSYVYFAGSRQLPGEKTLSDARQKFDEVYEKSRDHLTMPLVSAALKTFSEIKSIKNDIVTQAKKLSSSDGFNLDNAENMTSEIGNLIQKLGQLADLIKEGFSSKKSVVDIADEKDGRAGKNTKAAKATDKRKKQTDKKRSVKK